MGKFRQVAYGLTLLSEKMKEDMTKDKLRRLEEDKEFEKDKDVKSDDDDDDDDDCCDFNQDKERTCVTGMIFDLLWFMGISGVFHMRIDNWHDEEEDKIKNKVQLGAKGVTKVSENKVTYIEEVKIPESLENRNYCHEVAVTERIEMKTGKIPFKFVLWGVCWPVQKVYSFVVMLLLWYFLVRSFFILGVGKQELLFILDKTSGISWVFLCAVSATILFRAGHCNEKMRKFFMTWLRYSECNDMTKLAKCIKVSSWFSIIAVSIGVAVNMTFFMLAIFYFGTNAKMNAALKSLSVDFFSEPFYTHYMERNGLQNQTANYTGTMYLKETPGLTIITFLALLYCNLAWLLAPVLFHIICHILDYELKTLKTHYDEHILTPSNIRGAKILRIFESLRARHAGLCDLIAIVDDIFASFIFCSFMCNLIMACSLCFRIIKTATSGDAISVITPSVWMAMAFIHLSIVCIGSGKVNDSAHALNDSVYLTSFKKGANAELLNKINVFLHKLHGPSIGFTAWKLYVVDRSSILTVCSTFLAYLVVLLTFPQE